MHTLQCGCKINLSSCENYCLTNLSTSINLNFRNVSKAFMTYPQIKSTKQIYAKEIIKTDKLYKLKN